MSKANAAITTLDNSDEVQPVDKSKPEVIKFNVNDPDMSGDLVTITISQGEGTMGKQPVFLNVNATPVLIPRSKKVTIPVELKEALDNCVQDVQEPAEDGVTMETRQVSRFAYTVHEFIKADVKAKK